MIAPLAKRPRARAERSCAAAVAIRVAIVTGVVIGATPRPAKAEVWIHRQLLSDRGRWQLGTGGTVGWRRSFDVDLRRYVGRGLTLGGRLAFDRDAAPRGGAIYLTYPVMRTDFGGNGGRHRVELLVAPGAGWTVVGGQVAHLAAAGLTARLMTHQFQSRSYIVELGARALWAPGVPTTLARALEPPAAYEHRVAAEVSVAVGFVWPGPSRECETLKFD